MMEKAEHYLYITTPYLMIDDGLLSSLKLCAKSGVDVRIVTPSHPDKKLVHFTTRSYYRELIASGVKVYEYADGFIHAKSFLVDDTVASVGTVNLDFRSLYFHFECGTCLYRTSSIAALKQDYLDTLQHCRQITAEDCRTTPPVRLMQDVFRLFAPLM
jgi:cardiolipin synthase